MQDDRSSPCPASQRQNSGSLLRREEKGFSCPRCKRRVSAHRASVSWPYGLMDSPKESSPSAVAGKQQQRRICGLATLQRVHHVSLAGPHAGVERAHRR